MSTMGEDLDLELEDEEEEEQGGSRGGAGGEELTPEQQRIKDLETQLAEARSAPKGDPSMAKLLELGQAFLEKQTNPGAPPDNSADVTQFGELLQKAIISGDPKEAGNVFLQAVDRISSARMQQTLDKVGTPLAEKAGDFTVQAFLTKMGDELGPNAEKTHRLVAKDFALAPNERAWIATASAADADSFLRKRYKEVAGDVLLRSSKNARPKKLDGGSAAGPGGAGNLLNFPGVDARRARELQKLAEEWWPDPKVREEKIKSVAAQLAAEG